MTPAGATMAPRENPWFVGHSEAEELILGLWRRDALPQSWLFEGPAGVGKATFAFRVARFLLKHGLPPRTPPEASSEGAFETLGLDADDPIFRRVASGGDLDLLTVDVGYDEERHRARAEIVVDDVRRINRFLRATPVGGGWRIVIVDHADAINRNAQNALLKIIEEPPMRSMAMLVTDAPGRLAATLRSRCRRLTFRRLDQPVVEAWIDRHLPHVSPEERRLLARSADGSPGRVAMLCAGVFASVSAAVDQAFGGSTGKLDAAPLIALVGAADGDEAFTIASDLILARLHGIALAAAGCPGDDAGVAGSVVSERSLGRSGEGDLDRWLGVWEKTADLLGRARAARLDRGRLILAISLMIEGALEASRPLRTFAP